MTGALQSDVNMRHPAESIEQIQPQEDGGESSHAQSPSVKIKPGDYKRVSADLENLDKSKPFLPVLEIENSPPFEENPFDEYREEKEKIEPSKTIDFKPGQTTRHTIEMEVDNEQRSFLLHVPENYDPKEKTPLILAYHGISSTGEQMESRTGFSDKAERDNFIVAYMEGDPSGKRHSWNNGQLAFSGLDDIKFTKDTIAKLSEHLNIDPGHTYAVGFSQGESMVHRLANSKELKGQFKAIGVVGGWMTGQEKTEENNENPDHDDLSVISIKSGADPTSPYEGKFHWGFANMKPESYEENFYRQRNEIKEPASANYRYNADNKLIASEFTSTDISSGAVVKRVRLEDEGHIWPGVKETKHKENNATDMILDFFKSLDKK